VTGLFGNVPFSGFGRSRFGVVGRAPVTERAAASSGQLLRRAVRSRCPRQPGVYGMVDQHGTLIYVGKAKCLRTRLASYFRTKSRDPKAGRIVQATRGLIWECLPSEFAALLRELELIHRWRPRFNVQGQPTRYRRTYVCLGRQPAPYVYLARRPARDVLASFGPVPASRRAREAVRRLNDWYQLRDCSRAQVMHFADQGELFPVIRAAGCLRHEIGTCLGPCSGGCTSASYTVQLQAVHAFLTGTDTTALDTLHRDMMTAAAEQQFEQAAALRDRWEALDWLRTQLDRIRRAQDEHSFVYKMPGPGRSELWYAVHRGQVKAVLPAPRTEKAKQAALSKIEQVFGAGAWAEPASVEEVDVVLLVAAWFRRHPDERNRTAAPEAILSALGGENAGSGSRHFNHDARDVVARVAIECELA